MRTDATPPPVTQAPDTLAARLRGLAGRCEVLILGLLVVTAIVGQYISSKFLSTASFTSGTLDYSEVALMALPLALVIITAEIDLSVASVLALSSAVMGWMWAEGYSMGTIIVVCLAVGALCGAFNGALVTQLGLPSLAVTIGTLALFRGLAFVVIGDRSETSFPTAWTDWAFDEFAGTPVPNTIALFAVLAVAFAVLLHATRFGRAVFAIGANQETATIEDHGSVGDALMMVKAGQLAADFAANVRAAIEKPA